MVCAVLRSTSGPRTGSPRSLRTVPSRAVAGCVSGPEPGSPRSLRAAPDSATTGRHRGSSSADRCWRRALPRTGSFVAATGPLGTREPPPSTQDPNGPCQAHSHDDSEPANPGRVRRRLARASRLREASPAPAREPTVAETAHPQPPSARQIRAIRQSLVVGGPCVTRRTVLDRGHRPHIPDVPLDR